MLLLLPSAHFLCANPIRILPFLSSPIKPWRRPRLTPLCRRPETPSSGAAEPVLLDSLRVLEWDKLCDCVASFAGTPLGRKATKEMLQSLDVTFEESKHLLSETASAAEMLKYGIGGVDFNGIDAVLVKSAIEHILRGYPIKGTEALAVATLIQYAEILQTSLKAVLKEGEDSHKRFMPLTEVILELVISHPFVKMIHKVIDEEGCVKDSASPELKRLRDQVRSLEKKLYQLMDKLVRNESTGVSLMEATVVSGRWCIKTVTDRQTEFEGLLLSSGSGLEYVVEPLIAVPLNDELHQARSLVAKAEENVLSQLTDKILTEIDAIQKLLGTVIKLDVIFARAKYSVSYEGVFPDLYLSKNKDELFAAETDSSAIKTSSGTFHLPIKGKWNFFACKAYHPLLLHQYQQNLQRARKEVTTAESEIRRARTQGLDVTSKADTDLPSLRLKVEKLEKERPIPVDLMISQKTNVLVITGPNTGGKTISLKTIGLVSLMAKSGLYVLASEPVQLPWFDAIFADIGDEQSLLQSLSTFSGHLKQITAIRSKSTSQSLVLLDEVGAGTNPLEGAALGMSLLESFSEGGALLTVATTHHGELKTLKYRNFSFENACVEFDEVELRPTYRILCGVPGRSNAINIAEKLGLPNDIVDKARRLYGVTSAEINEVITDMEMFKQDFQHDLQEAQNYLMMSRENYRNLLVTNDKIHEHNTTLRAKRTQAILDVAARSRSALRNMLRQFRESTVPATEDEKEDRNARSVEHLPQELSTSTQVGHMQPPNTTTTTATQTTEKHVKIPKKGDMVLVRSLGKKVMVLKVETSKGEIVVQANNMKLRLKLSEVGV